MRTPQALLPNSLSAGVSAHSHRGACGLRHLPGGPGLSPPPPPGAGPRAVLAAQLSSSPAETRLGPGGRSTLSQPQDAQRQG